MSQPARMLVASVVLVIFVGVCLLVLTSLRDRLLMRADVVVYEEPVREYQPTRQYVYDDVYRLVDLQLISGPQSQGWRRVSAADGVDTREIFGSFPHPGRLSELAQHIEQTRAPARLDIAEPQGVIQLYWEGEPRLTLIFEPPAPVDRAQRSRIAIIIDDLGPSLTTLRQFLDLGLPLTPSILPGSDRAGASAELLRKAGREYLIHVPMEPRSYPQTNPGADALLLQHSEVDIRRWMQHYRDQVPGAVGMNNHMGSRFTEYAEPMQIVLDELKRQDLFFVDSVTISSSVAFAEARRMGLKTAARDIFLDNEENVDYIRRQLRKMVQLAKKQPEVIAIAHPYPETLEALRLEKDWLLSQPIDFVPASRLVKRYNN
ncbi:divergent polysaccharide deacetylase family protein [Pelovirga terrestris]|uniref:Divergent polysaccharide deacetylase family protein n=1 Tax=Pelovirga terrestris TaxID=2771352 RepID=A0A8J6QM42_9BACT|nr:divergent polysaccharide deacetylase family protein [Pelovirga terrestris]MBD1399518.1 divergent polysaccharide deacetylase family protein [Pelovirga terrestris]